MPAIDPSLSSFYNNCNKFQPYLLAVEMTCLYGIGCGYASALVFPTGHGDGGNVEGQMTHSKHSPLSGAAPLCGGQQTVPLTLPMSSR